MSEFGGGNASRRRLAAVSVGLAVLFVLLTTGFVQLLRPLAERSGRTVATASQTSGSIAEAAAAAPVAAVAAAHAQPATNARAAYRPDFTGPRIAILVTELGGDVAQARAAMTALPREVGFAFSPYPTPSYLLAQEARAGGHEVWVGVPMQPRSWPRVSPGKNTLTVAGPATENLRRLDWALARVGPATGVTSIMGSAFTESAAALAPIIAELDRRHLAFIDSRVSGRSVALRAARDGGVPAALNDRFLDASGTIAANLAELEQAARINGSAIGFAQPLPASVAAIRTWAAGLEAKGMLLVPPGTLAR